MEMIMFFGFPFSFGLLEIRIGIVLLFCCAVEFFNTSLSSTYLWEYYFTIYKLFQHWTSWSCVPYAMVHQSVLQWTRGESVPLSLYERTFVAVLHFHFMTACYDCIPQMTEKETVFFRFQTIIGAQVTFFFFYFYNAFPHFFSTFTIPPSIPSLFHCPRGHESRRFQCQSRIKECILF